MNGLVVGVAFDAKLESVLGEDVGDALDLLSGSGKQGGLAAIEKAELLETDDEAFRRDAEFDFVIFQLGAHGGFELTTEFDEIGGRHVGGDAGREFGRRWSWMAVGVRVRMGGSRFIFVGECFQFLKPRMNGVGDADDVVGVAIGGGEEHDEEGEEKGDEVRVGHEPAIMTDVIFDGSAAGSHRDFTTAGPAAL